MDFVADVGLRLGITIPIRSRQHFSFVTVMGEENDNAHWEQIVSRNLAILKLIANYFDNIVTTRFSSDLKQDGILSERETEVLNWSAMGKTVEDIATILSISPQTVRVYLKRIYSKLEVENRAHAVSRAISLGLIDLI